MTRAKLLVTLFTYVLANASQAELCDYAPSSVIGGFGSGVVTAVSGTTAATSATLTASGFYAATHTSGMAILGSTAAGSSAAGTTGFMAGTLGTAAATAGGILLSPAIMIGATTVAMGTAGLEGYCFASGDRSSRTKRTEVGLYRSSVEYTSRVYDEIKKPQQAASGRLTDWLCMATGNC